MAFTQVTITGTFQNSDGSPASGGVRFQPTAVMRNATATTEINAQTAVHAQVTAGALSSVTLAATTDPGTTPTGVTYEVTEYLTGQPRKKYFIAVPHDGGTINLATHPRTGEVVVTAQNFYAPLGHDHDASDFGASGTPTSSTFLRGDNTWAVPPGGGSDQSGRAAALALILGR